MKWLGKEYESAMTTIRRKLAEEGLTPERKSPLLVLSLNLLLNHHRRLSLNHLPRILQNLCHLLIKLFLKLM